MSATLGWIDGLVIAAYFAAVLGIGLWVGRREKNTGDFFLGGRRQHWIVAGISIIATEVSALTYIAVPGDSFSSNWKYLQMYAGAFAGRMIVAYLLLPAFYGGQVTTVYEYLGQRFGPATRTTATFFFFASRTLGSGIRLLVASLALSEVFGWPLVWVIIASVSVTALYATVGGIKSIMWTDVLQAATFVVAPALAMVYLLHATPGTWAENLSTAIDAGKFKVLHWDWNPNNERSFWVLFIHATVMNVAAMGTDQDMTQRMLTCPDLKRGRRSLIFNMVVGFPLVCLFLAVGTMLWVHYVGTPSGAGLPETVIAQKDRIFPYFMAHDVPVGYGIRGLLIAGIFAAAMSSLASAIGALSSSAVTDLYRPLRPKRGESHYLLAARVFTVLFAIVLTAVAIAFAQSANLLWKVFEFAGLVFGGLLGVFLLGMLTRNRGRDAWNVPSMLISVVSLIALKFAQERTETVWIAWPWWIVVGTATTFLLGAIPCRAVNRGRA